MYTIDKVLRRVPQHGDAVPTQQGSPCANHVLNASMSSVRDFVLESGLPEPGPSMPPHWTCAAQPQATS